MVYFLWGGDKGENIRLNNFIITKVKAKSINYVAISTIASNKFSIDSIMLGARYFFDDTHDEILETIFSWEELYYNELISEG